MPGVTGCRAGGRRGQKRRAAAPARHRRARPPPAVLPPLTPQPSPPCPRPPCPAPRRLAVGVDTHGARGVRALGGRAGTAPARPRAAGTVGRGVGGGGPRRAGARLAAGGHFWPAAGGGRWCEKCWVVTAEGTHTSRVLPAGALQFLLHHDAGVRQSNTLVPARPPPPSAVRAASGATAHRRRPRRRCDRCDQWVRVRPISSPNPPAVLRRRGGRCPVAGRPASCAGRRRKVRAVPNGPRPRRVGGRGGGGGPVRLGGMGGARVEGWWVRGWVRGLGFEVAGPGARVARC